MYSCSWQILPYNDLSVYHSQRLVSGNTSAAGQLKLRDFSETQEGFGLGIYDLIFLDMGRLYPCYESGGNIISLSDHVDTSI